MGAHEEQQMVYIDGEDDEVDNKPGPPDNKLIINYSLRTTRNLGVIRLSDKQYIFFLHSTFALPWNRFTQKIYTIFMLNKKW